MHQNFLDYYQTLNVEEKRQFIDLYSYLQLQGKTIRINDIIFSKNIIDFCKDDKYFKQMPTIIEVGTCRKQFNRFINKESLILYEQDCVKRFIKDFASEYEKQQYENEKQRRNKEAFDDYINLGPNSQSFKESAKLKGFSLFTFKRMALCYSKIENNVEKLKVFNNIYATNNKIDKTSLALYQTYICYFCISSNYDLKSIELLSKLIQKKPANILAQAKGYLVSESFNKEALNHCKKMMAILKIFDETVNEKIIGLSSDLFIVLEELKFAIPFYIANLNKLYPQERAKRLDELKLKLDIYAAKERKRKEFQLK